MARDAGLRPGLADLMVGLAVVGVIAVMLVICVIRYLAGIVRDYNRWDRW